MFRIVKDRKLTQTQAGDLLGIKQPHVSLLMRNRAGTFSAEPLMEFLTVLSHGVEIRVKRARKDHGHVSVVVARRNDSAGALSPGSRRCSPRAA